MAFDVSNRDSFDNVKKWMESIFDHADQNVCKIMVGNKIDIEDRRVTQKEAQDLATSYNMLYFEASAKQNIGITVLFETLMT